jgi:N-hydroxyarylamine O-acetyltransferase
MLGRTMLRRRRDSRVTLLSGRIARKGGAYSSEFDHLALRVDLIEPRRADVGFGDCFLEPLRIARVGAATKSAY